MPIQSSSILKNVGPKQDVKYWAWADIVPTGTGGVGVVVDSASDSVYFSKYVSTSKVASDGRLLWTVPSASGLTYSTALDSSGNVYTASGEVVVTKYSPSGSVIWARYINTNGSVTSPGLTVGSSGDVYVVTSDSSTNAVLVKLNSFGSMVWARKISGVSSGFSYAAVDEANDRVYAAGYTQPAPGITEGTLIAFNLSGATQWQKRFGVPEVTGVNFAYSTGVDFYGSTVLVSFMFGFNGACPIFKYTKDGALANFTGTGIFGFWGQDESFGSCQFRVDKSNGDIVTTYRSGSYKKYTFNGLVELSSGRFITGYNNWGADVDLKGDMYFILYKNNIGSLVAKIKPNDPGTGDYGSFSLSPTATSRHYPDNSMQSWEDVASYSIISTSLTSTSTSVAGVTANPASTFSTLRTK
jgi:hypothetical protein